MGFFLFVGGFLSGFFCLVVVWGFLVACFWFVFVGGLKWFFACLYLLGFLSGFWFGCCLGVFFCLVGVWFGSVTPELFGGCTSKPNFIPLAAAEP